MIFFVVKSDNTLFYSPDSGLTWQQIKSNIKHIDANKVFLIAVNTSNKIIYLNMLTKVLLLFFKF